MERQTNIWTDVNMHGKHMMVRQMDKRMDGWTDIWTDGWTDI